MSEPLTAEEIAEWSTWGHMTDEEVSRLWATLFALQDARDRPGLDVERSISAMLDDELRRVEGGLSSPRTVKRARETYARHLAAQQREGAGS